jgi:manganese oxidase
MSERSLLNLSLTRRQLLKWGLISAGIGGSAIAFQQFTQNKKTQVFIPPLPTDEHSAHTNNINPLTFLRQFDYGKVKQENGKTIKEFNLTAINSSLQLNTAVTFNTWTYNNSIPGPTIRVKQGDRVRILFYNQGGHAHSIHFHGFHKSEMDGVKPIRQGTATIYEFDAEPYGIHLYHCHTEPVSRHIGKGLYGMFIIDPPNPRPPADEMVLIMAGYDTNEDNKNEFYAFNAIPHYYMHNAIPIYQNQLVRLYVLNMIENDAAATFHLHANMFKIYRTGSLIASDETDVITMGTAERHILEFKFKYPGKYMFHPHQDYMAENGCMGQFDVIART